MFAYRARSNAFVACFFGQEVEKPGPCIITKVFTAWLPVEVYQKRLRFKNCSK